MTEIIQTGCLIVIFIAALLLELQLEMKGVAIATANRFRLAVEKRRSDKLSKVLTIYLSIASLTPQAVNPPKK